MGSLTYVTEAEQLAVRLHNLRSSLTMSVETDRTLTDAERLILDYIRVLRTPASLRQAIPEIPWADLHG